MLKKYQEKLARDNEVYLRIKARPAADKTAVRDLFKEEEGETIKIDIAAPAERGRANQELIKFLAKEFSVAKDNIKIISGAGERIKLIKIIYNS